MKLQIVSLFLAFCYFYNDCVNGQPVVFLKRQTRAAKPEFKICVPIEFLEKCNQMVRAEPGDSSTISCVGGRDRLECLQLIQNRGADFSPVDPEDMWVAAQIPDEDFKVFDEIRTKEEPNNEFRYEGVAVVHKDEPITKISDIKGFGSCHTGVDRNVGYKIPLTRLRAMGIIGGLNDPELSAKENELKALSQLFSKACIVGDWSEEPEVNKKLKQKYSNLCSLCENPSVCNYPDKYSGYEGALRCLANNGGQIAWTKTYYVKKFFGMRIGPDGSTKETPNKPENYMYLCPNGTKFPITDTPPCIWAARPWQGYITNDDHISTINQLQKKLKELSKIGEETNAKWFEDVLTLKFNKTLLRESDVLSPKQYLDKANYTDVIARDYSPPKKYVRFCVLSDDETKKCNEFSKVAFSRGIRPEFSCIQQNSLEECLKLIRENDADVMTLDVIQVDLAKRDYNLIPILAESDNRPTVRSSFSVAVVKKTSSYQSLNDLRGTRPCHRPYRNTVKYYAPVYALLKQGLITNKQCPAEKAVSEFFSGRNCIPKEADASKCKSEIFDGCTGAFRCLATNQGDVAFVSHDTVRRNTDGLNTESWATGLKSEDYELLCPNGGRKSISEYANCHLAKEPGSMIVTNNAKNNQELDEIRHALVEAVNFFHDNKPIFNLFGSFNGKKNLLFKESTKWLVSIDQSGESPLKEYETMLKLIRTCESG